MTSWGPFQPKSTQIKRLDKAVEMLENALRIEETCHMVVWEETERGKLKKPNKPYKPTIFQIN